MFGRPLSRHHVLFISIYRGCGIAGCFTTGKFCAFVSNSVDYRISLPFKGNKGGSYEKKRVFP